MPKYPYYIPAPNVYKPWILVRLGFKKTHKVTQPVTTLIDSGADVCFCSKDIGTWLGVQFKNIKPVSFTAANSTTFNTYPEKITLYASGVSYECKFYFADDLPRETPIILGQLGFFDHFRITFDIKNQEIEIT